MTTLSRHWLASTFLLLALACPAAMATVIADEQVGDNLAAGKSYTLWPAPSYGHCTDPGDTSQLTDGLSTADYFWTQQGTVGWTSPSYARITVDLDRVLPIEGVAFTTAAGTAGVTWPAEIRILVSDDGAAYRDVGDLVALDHSERGPWPQGYAIRRMVTNKLATRGRYVQFVAIPLAGASYLFVDEVEVFRGDDPLLQRDPGGTPVEGAQAVFEQGRLRRALRLRYRQDSSQLLTAIEQSRIDTAVRDRLTSELADLQDPLETAVQTAEANLRAVLPIGDAHARLFQLQAQLWRATGLPDFWAQGAGPWDPLELIGVAPGPVETVVEVHTMRGEYRAAAVNLYNATREPMRARIRLEGLPGSPTPAYLKVHEVLWTDTAQSEPVAAALPEAPRTDGGWTVTVPPGLVRQAWLTFHVTDQAADRYEGRVVIEGSPGRLVEVPLVLQVWPFDFPDTTTLRLGGWSYTDGGGCYGVTPRNLQAFLEHMQSRFVNAPWATSGVLMSFAFNPQDPSRIELDTRRFDEWIAQWPSAHRYNVFLSVAHYQGAIVTSLGGAALDSPEFSRRVGTWISAWVRHLKSRGIRPDQLALLIHDEPHEGSDLGPLITWAQAIQAAEPDVIVWEDPTYRNPAAAPPELFDVCDVLCPNRPMWLGADRSFADFYRDQQRRGKVLELYSCSGPARLLDPYSYYRLQAWHAWRIGAEGSFFWALGDTGGASSWCEYFARSGPFTPVFLDEQSVTAGKHMEAIHESAEDYEYLVMLRAAIDEAKRTGQTTEAIARAEQALAAALATVLDTEDAAALRWHEPKDRSRADAARVHLLHAIKDLHE